LHDRLTSQVVSSLAAAENSTNGTALLEEVYFHAYTDPEVRRKVGYHHPLDTFR
jgi:hypothetical protein